MKYSLLFGILGLILVAEIALQAAGVRTLSWPLLIVEGYLASGFLTLSTVYSLRKTPIPSRVFFRDGWRLRATRFALGSYSVIAATVLKLGSVDQSVLAAYKS